MTDRLGVPRYRPRRLPELVDRALSIAVFDEDDDETRRTKRLLTGAVWVALLPPWPSIFQFISAEAPLAALAIGASFASSALVLLVLWLRPRWLAGAVHTLIGVNLMVSVAMTLMFGGFLQSGANFVWAIILLLGALAVFADWRAAVWLVAAITLAIASVIAARFVEPLYRHPDAELGALMSLVIVVTFAFFVLWYYVRQRAELLRLSDGLLANILPDAVATRLKRSNEMIADEYEAASILFADVAGFTPMSADLTPNQLVSLLNEIFSEFDALVEARGLEKIKTIGDSYMVAAGVPVPRPDHAQAICDLALEMREQMTDRTFSGHAIEFRIGINSGPVVAGIIGTKKFSYDLWGDAVNTASRMEAFGRPGRVQITEATKVLVEDRFVCTPGGVIEIKGKGPMRVYFLEGRRAAEAGAGVDT